MSGAFIAANRSRYAADARSGCYESFFQRANHPTRPLAFWIRYTRFSPQRRPQDAVGELWAVYFDGERGVHAVAKEVLPMSACHFACDRFEVRVGAAVLDSESLRGAVGAAGQRIGWDLGYLGDAPPLFLLPRFLYAAPLPRAKALVGLPLARFDGRLQVAGETVEVDGWIGSQNHNWGSRHTDRYAWGQVAGFDEAPDSFLELATAQLRIGPWWTPPLTPIVLRHEGVEYAFRALHRIAGTGAIDGFHWRFSGASGDARIEGSISARPASSRLGSRSHYFFDQRLRGDSGSGFQAAISCSAASWPGAGGTAQRAARGVRDPHRRQRPWRGDSGVRKVIWHPCRRDAVPERRRVRVSGRERVVRQQRGILRVTKSCRSGPGRGQ